MPSHFLKGYRVGHSSSYLIIKGILKKVTMTLMGSYCAMVSASFINLSNMLPSLSLNAATLS